MKHLNIPLVWLKEGDDRAVARAIEAGVYARHLLSLNGPDPALERVVEAGQEAAHIFWWVGLRIARRQSMTVARSANLPEDDLFQDACLAVARAVPSYDHARGVRYTTYVHHVVSQQLLDEDHLRPGAGNATRGDRRAARKAAAMRDSEHTTLEAAARAAGVSPAAAVRGSYRQVLLEPDLHDEASEAPMDAVTNTGTGFLELLNPLHRRILSARYLANEKLVTVAARHGVSHSTILRWEGAALAEARAVLEGDLTRRPPLSRGRQPATACGASPEPSTRRTAIGALPGP